MSTLLDYQPREAGPAHLDVTGEYGSNVDRERDAFFAESERAFVIDLARRQPLTRIVLPCKSAMHDRVTYQTVHDVLPELLLRDDVLESLAKVLHSECPAADSLRKTLAVAYDDVYGADVATIRAGVWL